MAIVLWALLAWPLVLAAEWIVRRALPSRKLPRNAWQLFLARLAAVALAGVPLWWIMDVPGYLQSLRLVRLGDAEGAIHAWHPLLRPEWTIWMVPLASLGVLVTGIHMVVRPDYWVGVASQIVPVGSPPGAGARTRFKVWGWILVVLGLVVNVALLVAWTSR